MSSTAYNSTLHYYIEQKIYMLTKDFMFKLKSKEIDDLLSCQSERQVDRVAHDILRNHL